MNPNIMRMLMASSSLNRKIEPTISVGGTAFTVTHSRSWTGNGVRYLEFSNSFTIPEDWEDSDWNYYWSITGNASYTCIGYQVYVYKNGILINSWSTPSNQDSWFRYNSGTRSGNQAFSTLKAGDVIKADMYITGRNVGGSTPTYTHHHKLTRTA
jgi:hypothetical protein